MPVGPSITWEIPVALLAHVALAATVAVGRCSSSDEPLFKPEDTIQVALSGPPKNVTSMPQKAERAPDAPKAPDLPQAPDTPPPPNASDMALKTPDAPKVKGDPNAEKLQKAIDDLKRRAAMDNLTADVGKVDRLASSPDGSEDAGSHATSGVNDPELARWTAKAREQVGQNWHPLRSLCLSNPGLEVFISVDLDANGNVLGAPTIKKKSGNTSFDEAGRRAVEATGSLPKPPAKYADGLSASMQFTGKECQ
ncbi:MAG: energy transducer TonB [Pseudomonadota bacterium]|nr:energy transducer TonB [Pseudomonadota bacterium]